MLTLYKLTSDTMHTITIINLCTQIGWSIISGERQLNAAKVTKSHCSHVSHIALQVCTRLDLCGPYKLNHIEILYTL